MAWWKFGRQSAPAVRKYAKNPHTNPKVRSAGFFSNDVQRLLSGWDTSSSSIDYYLQSELRELRARSRKMVRANPYGKRFIATIKSNVVGPNGVSIQAQTTRSRKGDLDVPANDAIEAAFKDWGTRHCDYHGKSTWVDLQHMAISCAAQDGEFIFEKVQAGKYGFQLKSIDPELLDVRKNHTTKGGGEVRLGVEYDKSGRVVAYHFRKKQNNDYDSGDSYSIVANRIFHGFISEWPDQSRGAPWMHASLERSKHLEKYDESAIVKARSTASTMAVLRTTTGEDAYEGDEEYADGVTLDQYEAGTIKDIGNREIVNLDSDYPHQMYAQFVKAQLQGIASGLGVSYHALSNDLEGVNYSSIRAGVLEDREVFKGLQNWFIRCLIQPVFEEWLLNAWARRVITIGTRPLNRPPEDYLQAHYQPRRWAWVDPQKDGAANKLAIDERLKSRSQIMREQGDDPESVWREIHRDEQMMKKLGIQPIVKESQPMPVEADNEP
ncbi:MAG: phage portal protein [Anaerolineae bacterium]|nr:phage portal protein [Anaerolineae bacterium]